MSNRYRRYYAKRPPAVRTGGSVCTKRRSSFLLRVNLCLGMTIIVVAIVKMNNDVSDKIYDCLKSAVSENITAADIENEKTRLTYILGINKEMVKLDDDVSQIIKNEADR